MKENLQLHLKTWIKSVMLLSVIIGLGGCEDKDEFTPDPISGDVELFYSEVQGANEGDSFDASSEHIFITNSNTSVHIPANSLVYADGTDVFGEVRVTLEDVLNKGELVVHNIPTLSSEKLLISEGALFVMFTQDNNELYIKPGSLITIRLTAPDANASTQLYDGLDMVNNNSWNFSSQSMSLESWSFFWDGKDWIDSGYELYLTETGWYSVALELSSNDSLEEPICVNLPRELYDGSNSDVFLILDDYDTVVPLEMDSEKLLFCASFSNIPLGSEATIVSVSSLGEGNYHFGTSRAIISTDNGELYVFPKSQTKEQILDLLGMF